LWYAKDKTSIKYRNLFVQKNTEDDSSYNLYENEDGQIIKLNQVEDKIDQSKILTTSSLLSSGHTESCYYDFNFKGKKIKSGNKSWKTNLVGMNRLIKANRLSSTGNIPRFKRYLEDFPVQYLTNNWNDTFSDSKKLYVVQSPIKVIERCILMTSDPGDLVLDPTCGGGTTAFVSEKHGRRWITIDTSRVSLCLTRIRLMSANYDYYKLNDNNLRNGFEYKKVKHIQLKDISRNEKIELIYDEFEKKVNNFVKTINKDIKKKLDEYELVKIKDIKNKKIQKSLEELKSLIKQRDDQINKSIEENSGFEILYDKASIDKSKVRVCGKFTVESLSPNKSVYDTNIDGKISQMEEVNRTEFLQVIKDYLEKNPIKSLYKEDRVSLEKIETITGGLWINLKANIKDTDKNVAIFIGPETGTVNAEHVRESAKEAVKGTGYDILYILGFSFDPYVVEVCKENFGKLKVIPIRMNNDLQSGLRDELKNTGVGNIFMVFGEPDISVKKKDKSKIIIKINGLDVYDPTSGSIRNNSIDDIACWFLDTDYDGESFFVKQAYFVGNEKEFNSLKKTLRMEINLEEWTKLNSTESLPFKIPESKKIAIKVINHFGDEIIKVYDDVTKLIK
jgi:adenine-specific DNA-methyltransferase